MDSLLKNFYIDFVIDFLLLVDWKRNNYNAILVLVDWLVRIIYYKMVKTTIDILGVVEVTINIVVWYSDLLKSIISNYGLLFISKFGFLLC